MLGENIVALRVSKAMNRGDLSKALGIKHSTLSNYENGVREPDIKTLCDIADFFQVSLDELVGREFPHTERSVL